MREIKFKLWCKTKSEWEKDLWWIGCDNNLYTVIHGQLRDMKKENHILCQFTGLHDKNGKEIYEGDIIKVSNPACYIQKAEYISEVFSVGFAVGFEVVFIKQWHGYSKKAYPPEVGECFYFINLDKEYEVIGNIYSNPELLEVKP